MGSRSRTQEEAASRPMRSFTPVRTHLLQRKCACGGTPGPDGECAECRRKRLRRRAADRTEPGAAPPIVHDVLRSPGVPLDPATRASFEPRFGHDFSQMRVHTDAKAAASARTVNARAYTVGSDLVFGAGQFRPRTPEGDHLLAHELAHVVQQRSALASDTLTIAPGEDRCEREADAVGAAVMRARSAGDVAFGDAGAVHIPPLGIMPGTGRWLQKDPGNGAETKVKEKAPDAAELTRQIVATLKPGITGIEFKRSWPGLAKQIKSPVVAKPKPTLLQKKYPELFAEEFVTDLKKLTGKQRETIAADVEGQLATAITGVAADELKKEYETTLHSSVRGNIEGGYPGYVAVRSGLLNTFGTLAKANEYYKSMVSAEFPSASSSVRGAKTSVHPNLKKQLQSAASVLKSRKVGGKTWLEIAEAGIKGIGGFNIRENRNDTSQLSDHSFGWAIDIDTELNPNVKPSQFPKALVEGFTGEDVYGGAAATAFRSGGTVDELLPHARTLRSASDKFKAGFESEAALKTAVIGYLSERGLTIDDTQATALLDLLKAGTKKNKFKKKEIEEWLSSAKTPATGSSGTAAASKATATSWSEAPKIASFLIEAYRVFRGTTSGGKKIHPSMTGTPQTIAAHGFLNLPAELIAALTGSDGGNLDWLGAVKEGKTKDFMHFQLKSADRPTLPKGTSPSAESETDEAE